MLTDYCAFLKSERKKSSAPFWAKLVALGTLVWSAWLPFGALADPLDIASLPLFKIQLVQKNPNGNVYNIGDRIALYVEIPQADQNRNSSFEITVPEGGSKIDEQGWYLDAQTNLISGNLRFIVAPIKTGPLTLPTLLILNQEKNPIGRTDTWSIEVKGVSLSPDQQKREPQYLPLAAVGLSDQVWFMLFALVLLLIAATAFGIYKWNRKKAMTPPALPTPKPIEPDHVLALRALQELYQQNPYTREHLKPVAFGISEIIKAYLSKRFLVDATESTTPEMIGLLKSQLTFDELKEIEALFVDLDLIKFTKMEQHDHYTEGDYKNFKLKAERIIDRWNTPAPAASGTVAPAPSSKGVT